MSRSWTRSNTAVAALSAVTALALLTACGGGDGDSSDAGKGTADKPVTLTFWAWQKGSKDVVDAFNASHKNIRVTFEEIPSGNAEGLRQDLQRREGGQRPGPGRRRIPDAARVRQPGRAPGHRPVPDGRRAEEVPAAGGRPHHAGRQKLGRTVRRRAPDVLLPQGLLREEQDRGAEDLGGVPYRRREGEGGRPEGADRDLHAGRPHHLRGDGLAGRLPSGSRPRATPGRSTPRTPPPARSPTTGRG